MSHTHANVVAGVSRAFIGSVHVCVCVYVCVHSKTKTTGRITTKLVTWTVHDKSWSTILFEVKRLNVKVTGSINVTSESSMRLINYKLVRQRAPTAISSLCNSDCLFLFFNFCV